MCTDFEVQYYLKWLFLIVNYASCYFELNNLQAEEVVRKVPFAEELLKTGLLLEFVFGVREGEGITTRAMWAYI